MLLFVGSDVFGLANLDSLLKCGGRDADPQTDLIATNYCNTDQLKMPGPLSSFLNDSDPFLTVPLTAAFSSAATLPAATAPHGKPTTKVREQMY